MASRDFHPVRLAGGMVLGTLAMASLGCFEQHPYVPPSASTAEESAVEPTSAPSEPATLVQPVEPEPLDVAPEPEVERPVAADRYAEVVSETPPSTPSPGIEHFPGEVGKPGTPEPTAGEAPTVATSQAGGSDSEVVFPWDEPASTAGELATEESARAAAGTVAIAPDVAEPTGPPTEETSRVMDPVFPWDEPSVPPINEDPPAGEPLVESSPVVEPSPPALQAQPAIDEMANPVAMNPGTPLTDRATPIESTPQVTPAAEPSPPYSPATSHHAAWLLGSKMSYALLAPAEEAEGVIPELAPLASLLGVDLPVLDYDRWRTASDGMTRMLTAGRQVGEQLANRHSPGHAALVEIAIKSNLLMAVYAERPHLAHSIGGAVSAACVRAGVPAEIWQPWQDAVTAGGSTEAITSAVIDLHTEIDQLLRNPPNESAQAIVR